MGYAEVPRRTRNSFRGRIWFLKLDCYFVNNVGGKGTFPHLQLCWYQTLRGPMSGSEVHRVYRMQHQALGDYELVYSVSLLGFYSVE